MSHTYDVINLWFKKGMQKLRKMSHAKAIDSFELSIPGIVYRLKYQGPYFFLLLWMLPEGQEIDHMIKNSAK